MGGDGHDLKAALGAALPRGQAGARPAPPATRGARASGGHISKLELGAQLAWNRVDLGNGVGEVSESRICGRIRR